MDGLITREQRVSIIQMHALLPFLLVLAVQAALPSSNDCPEQHTPDPSHICIRPEYLPGCNVYRNTRQCQTCDKDYQLVNGQCSLVDSTSESSSHLIGCLLASNGQCINCANGYRRIDGVCVIGTKECVEYQEDGSCRMCLEEYSLLFGECRHNLLLGCRTELGDHRCADCFTPFELDSYSCRIKNCKSYNDYGCYSCECGYYVTEGYTCRKMEEGCLKYYRGSCSQCLPHYRLHGGSCLIEGCLKQTTRDCTSCGPEYDLVEGSCLLRNCLDWKDGRCLICQRNYNLVGGKCVAHQQKFVCAA